MVFSKQVDPKIIEKINGVILKKMPDCTVGLGMS